MQIFQFTEQEYQAIIKKLDDLNEKNSGNPKELRKIIYDIFRLNKLVAYK